MKVELMTDLDALKEQIDPEAIAELALRLANTFSPGGHEQPLADVVYRWFQENGLTAYKQPILHDRANVVAVLKGTGGSTSLIFNSHTWIRRYPDPNTTGAWHNPISIGSAPTGKVTGCSATPCSTTGD